MIIKLPTNPFAGCKNKAMKGFVKRFSLKQNIFILLMLGWVVPLLLMTALLATFVTNKSKEQIIETVNTSVDNAASIFELQLDELQLASKNASYYSNIREAYQTYTINSNTRDLDTEVNNFLKLEYKYNKLTKAAILDFTNQDKVYYTYNNSASASYRDISFYLKNVSDTVLEKSEELYTGMMLYSDRGHNYLVRNLVLSSFKPYAVLSLEINNELLEQAFEGVWGYDDMVILLDGEYMLGNEQLSENFPKEEFDYKKEYSFATKTIERNDQKIEIVIRLDNSVIFQKQAAMWFLMLFMIIALIPLTIVIFNFFNKSVISPIDVMMKAYEEVGSKNNLGYQIKNKASNREFYYMQKSFNEMSKRVEDQFDQLVSEEIALRDAKIMALQSQINPHFLNNTFEIINWEARLNGNIKVSRMIEALSTMLEATMNRDGNNLHSLNHELGYVDAYAYIITERLGDRFSYIKEIDESLLDTAVPKLIVQPIVENAVEHGLSEVKKGAITLKLYSKDDHIIIEVINDGNLSPEDEAKIKRLLSEKIDTTSDKKEPSLSLGIKNVNNRIKLIYGDDCGLFIENCNSCTVSTIKVKNYQKQQFLDEGL
ncbi:MAG: histidine kinase [Bacteroidaceae bacterium]|nr:histidine kinase [Bacteroidaceae bacterium]